jgi:hypothetical protein
MTYDAASGMPLADVLDRYQALNDRDSMARAIATLKARGVKPADPALNPEGVPPLTTAGHLELLALGEALARYYRHPVQVHHAVLAGASWQQVAAATGGDPEQARRAYRAWAEGQHRLRQDFPGGTIGLGDDEYAAAVKAAGGSPEPEGDGVRAQMPGSSVVVTYASQRERDRSLRLARARQDIADEGGTCPTWAELTDGEQEMAALEARNWLRAAVRCGIAAPAPASAEGQP